MARTKSIVTQMQQVLDQMADMSGEDKPDKVRVILLQSRLDTLRYLHQQEADAERKALITENENLKREVADLKAQPPSDDALLNAQVAAMMARHNWGVAENKSVFQLPVKMTPPPLTRDEGTSHINLRPAPVEDDPDLVT